MCGCAWSPLGRRGASGLWMYTDRSAPLRSASTNRRAGWRSGEQCNRCRASVSVGLASPPGSFCRSRARHIQHSRHLCTSDYLALVDRRHVIRLASGGGMSRSCRSAGDEAARSANRCLGCSAMVTHCTRRKCLPALRGAVPLPSTLYFVLIWAGGTLAAVRPCARASSFMTCGRTLSAEIACRHGLAPRARRILSGARVLGHLESSVQSASQKPCPVLREAYTRFGIVDSLLPRPFRAAGRFLCLAHGLSLSRGYGRAAA